MGAPAAASPLFIGVMSGTSLDGIDIVVTDLGAALPRVVAARTFEFTSELRADLAFLCRAETVPLELLGTTDGALGEVIADAVLQLLDDAGISSSRIAAIGSHGQTIRHAPRHDRVPFTMQIGDPNRIAERTSMTVVADFRRRDIAAGGEGAPLVPAFHAAVFGARHDRVVVNIGGMANITLLPAAAGTARRRREVTGFDTGPGNVLLDAWAARNLGSPRDEDGAWAAQGRIDEPLLERLLADSYFAQPAPKSTGREHFDLHWLQDRLEQAPAPASVQATLTELTARTIAHGIRDIAAMDPTDVLVCGGGRHNSHLMERIGAALPGVVVCTTDELDVDGDWVEGIAFAWLARERLAGRAANVPAVTGASGPRILGSVYPGVPGAANS